MCCLFSSKAHRPRDGVPLLLCFRLGFYISLTLGAASKIYSEPFFSKSNLISSFCAKYQTGNADRLHLAGSSDVTDCWATFFDLLYTPRHSFVV